MILLLFCLSSAELFYFSFTFNHFNLDLILISKIIFLSQGTTVCLADFCDIFRCEVFENPRKDFFWEKKLCKEDRLTVRRRRCEVTD